MTPLPLDAVRQALDDTEAALARLRPALGAAYGIAGENLTAAAGQLDVAERAQAAAERRAERAEADMTEIARAYDRHRRTLAAIFARSSETPFEEIIEYAARTLTRTGGRLLAGKARADRFESAWHSARERAQLNVSRLRVVQASRRRWKRRAKTAEQRLATVRQYLAAAYPDDIASGVRDDLALILDGRPAQYSPLESQ